MPHSLRRGVVATGREALALCRQAVLLPRDTFAVLPDGVRPGDDVVVFLHGLFATAGVLRPMRSHVEARTGARTATFTYAPGRGVAALAHRMSALLARLPDGVRLHLVGHSLGGLVVRYYVQFHPRDPRVAQTISLAAPFAGTRQVRWLPGGLRRDLAPGSPLLGDLAAGPSNGHHVPHTSVVAEMDGMVTPAESAVFPGGSVVVLTGRGHNALLFDPDVFDIVVRCVERARDGGGR